MQINVLTIAQAAELYKGTALTETAIRRLIKTGQLKSRRVGTKYLILESTIEEWLNGTDEEQFKNERYSRHNS